MKFCLTSMSRESFTSARHFMDSPASSKASPAEEAKTPPTTNTPPYPKAKTMDQNSQKGTLKSESELQWLRARNDR